MRSRPSAADRSTTSEHEVPNDTKPAPPKLVTSSTTPQLKKTASTSSLTPVKTRPKVSTSPRLHTTPGATRTSQMRAAAAAQSDSQVAPVRHERAVSSTTSGSSSRATATTSSRPPTASSRTTVSTSPRSRKVSETGRPSFSPPKSPMSRSTSGEDKPHPPGTSQPPIVYLRKQSSQILTTRGVFTPSSFEFAESETRQSQCGRRPDAFDRDHIKGIHFPCIDASGCANTHGFRLRSLDVYCSASQYNNCAYVSRLFKSDSACSAH